MAAATLVTGGCIVTMDPERRVLDDAAVLVVDGLIACVGSAAECADAAPSGVTVVDATDMLVLPGLVDCHAHAGHALVKTLGGDVGSLWYDACHQIYTVGSTEAFWESEAELAALERLKCGTTCGVSYLGGGDSVNRTDDVRYGDGHCRAVERVGTRSVVALGVNRPKPNHEPWTYADYVDGERVDKEVTLETQLATCAQLIDEWHEGADGRVRIAMTCPVHHASRPLPEGVSEADVEARCRKARALCGRKPGVTFTQDGHNAGSVATALAHGLLGADAFLSHSTDLVEADFAALQESKATIVHNPSANASITGRCPVPELLEAGVGVGLGSDGTAPNRSADMWRHMQQCMHYHRRFFQDSDVLPPGKVLEMCTIDAAAVLGMADMIGSLEVGKQADLICINLAAPHLAPLNMPVSRAIYFANGADVDTVMVGGKILMQGREVLSVNESDVLARASAEAEGAIERLGLEALLQERPGFWGHSRFPPAPTPTL
jgi:5-methylthioadenosine/S-adenosylhomocysteine deaminase